MLRQINDLVDFSFVLEELKHKYGLITECSAADSHVHLFITHIPAVKEKLNVLKVVVKGYTEQLHFSTDSDARVGHKKLTPLSLAIKHILR